MSLRKLVIGAVLCSGLAMSASGQQADLSVSFAGQHNGTICPTPPNGCVPQQIPIAPGGQALFLLVISNSGPATATNVVATMTFPAKTVIHFGSLSMTCSQSVVAGQPTLMCSIPSVGVGNQPSVFVQLDINSDYTSPTLTGSVVVTSETVDPNLTNNNGSATLPVTLPIPTLSPVSTCLLGIALSAIGFVAMRRV